MTDADIVHWLFPRNTLKNRVVITGLGVVTPIGNNKETFWSSLKEGRGGIAGINSFDASEFSSQIAGLVKNFEPLKWMQPKELKRMDRFTQIALVSAIEAFADSGIEPDKENLDRIGVLVGSGIGGISIIEKQHNILLKSGPRRISPFFIPMLISDMASGQIAIRFGLKGPNSCAVTACASGAHAIGDSFRILQYGDADVMVTGGTEAAVTPLALAGFCSMKALSTRNDDPEKASRPFDRERDGFIMAEGAGILVLDSLRHALDRNARIYAEIVGFGMTGDAYHVTAPAPEGEGAARAMQCALSDAGLNPEDVDYINSHGTSTPLNDKLETTAIKNVFGSHAYKLCVNSTKSMTGHLLGASGAVELAACIMAIQESIVHPTVNYEYPDPDCDLNYVPNTAIKKEIKIAMSNSLGFGGHNATLILRKYQG